MQVGHWYAGQVTESSRFLPCNKCLELDGQPPQAQVSAIC